MAKELELKLSLKEQDFVSRLSTSGISDQERLKNPVGNISICLDTHNQTFKAWVLSTLDPQIHSSWELEKRSWSRSLILTRMGWIKSHSLASVGQKIFICFTLVLNNSLICAIYFHSLLWPRKFDFSKYISRFVDLWRALRVLTDRKRTNLIRVPSFCDRNWKS